MSNITRLPGTPDTIRHFKTGDITRALGEGLKHEQIAAEIEKALEHLVFVAGSEDIQAARELLADLLYALPVPRSLAE